MNDRIEPSIKKLDASTGLAVERTFLAQENTLPSWLRTSVSLISFGFSIQQFFRIARADAPDNDRLIGPQEFGLLMILIGLASLAIAIGQHRYNLRALETRYAVSPGLPFFPRSRARLLALLIALLGAAAFLSMVLRN